MFTLFSFLFACLLTFVQCKKNIQVILYAHSNKLLEIITVETIIWSLLIGKLTIKIVTSLVIFIIITVVNYRLCVHSCHLSKKHCIGVGLFLPCFFLIWLSEYFVPYFLWLLTSDFTCFNAGRVSIQCHCWMVSWMSGWMVDMGPQRSEHSRDIMMHLYTPLAFGNLA